MLISTQVFAIYPKIQINGLTGSFSNSEGMASATSASYEFNPVKIAHEAITLDLSLNSKEVSLHDGTTTVKIKIDLSFLDILQQFNFHEAVLKSNMRIFEIYSDVFNLYVENKEITIKELTLISDLQNNTEVEDDATVLDGFLMEAELKAKAIDFTSAEVEGFYSDILEENPSRSQTLRRQLRSRAKVPLTVRNAHVSVKDGSIKIFAKLDSWINANLKFNGTAEYDKKEGKLIITVAKIKVGIFKVTKTVLKQLKKLDLGSVKVEGNKIIIPLSKKISQ